MYFSIGRALSTNLYQLWIEVFVEGHPKMEIKSIAFQVLLSVSSTLVIIIVLFSDFLPFFWGSYDGQRFM